MDTTTAFRKALEYATATIESIARDAGYSREAFDTYRNRREPSRPAALALAAALEERADRLREHAASIREAAGEAGGTPDSI